jgi:hypothetical protein
MAMTGELHALAALPPRKESRVSIGKEINYNDANRYLELEMYAVRSWVLVSILASSLFSALLLLKLRVKYRTQSLM